MAKNNTTAVSVSASGTNFIWYTYDIANNAPNHCLSAVPPHSQESMQSKPEQSIKFLRGIEHQYDRMLTQVNSPQ